MSIFEKIGEKLSGAGQGVAQQVKNFADVARLNSIISEKEKQIAQLYIEIGQAYYEHHKIDPQGEEIERIQKISSLNAEILECKENIKQIKGVTKCPNCGADVSLDAAFCNACGTKIPPAAKAWRNRSPEYNRIPSPAKHPPVPWSLPLRLRLWNRWHVPCR